MMKSIILIGGGGHCKSCIDVIEQEGNYQIAGIIDVTEKIGQKIQGYPIIGTDMDLSNLIRRYKNVLITVGQIKSASVRIKLFNQLKLLNAQLPVIRSPKAYISKHTIIKQGTIVMHHALINAGAVIGANCIINSKSLIEHEAIIGDHCHISTGSTVNGQVIIDDECFIGSGATLVNNIQIRERVIIPAGKTVYTSVEKTGVYTSR